MIQILYSKDVIESSDKSFTIIKEPEIIEDETLEDQRLHITGTFNGKHKKFNCSKVNARFIVESVQTSDVSEWIGIILILETYKTKKDGEMIDAINIKEVRN
ncbi:hypothetical protein GOV12_02370 [Candidatus Pacearchaeota archaeon]|nr:hypothetical protein [Candidatus Pacearchaeota archaeon]